jgi:hypothetical protein
MFAPTSEPQHTNWDEVGPVQLGMAFTTASSGDVLGVRFFKGTQDVGEHTGSLWGPDGVPLATVTFVDESASGWQYAVFDTAVSIQPGVEYTVSYRTPAGRYAVTVNGLADAQTNGPLVSNATGGRYGYSGDIPSSAANHNYWVDVMFRPSD